LNVFVVGPQRLGSELSEWLSRLKVKVESSEDEKAALKAASSARISLFIVDVDRIGAEIQLVRLATKLRLSKKPFIVLSTRKDHEAFLMMRSIGAADYVIRPYSQREFMMRFNAVLHKKKRIACIGGGTGLFTLLLGLKTLPNALLVSIVNMSDDGGSSGKLSQTFGILPPGDIRRSLVALSNAPELMNQIIQHRFDKGGDLHGHSFGNIFLTVLAEVKGSMSEAVRALSDILNIQGIVLPSSRTLTKLVARFQDGTVVKGESKIDLCEGRKPSLKISKIWHEPESEGEADAYASILNSDVVTIGPGDLFTSVITNLAVKDIREALLKTKAKKIYVCNLMTKPGETTGFTAADHVREVVHYLGADCLDYVLVSKTVFSEESVNEYSKKSQVPVPPGTAAGIRKYTKAKVVFADVADEKELVRHDSQKLRTEIEKIIRS
jgi:uncharacterized cofD-like protein